MKNRSEWPDQKLWSIMYKKKKVKSLTLIIVASVTLHCVCAMHLHVQNTKSAAYPKYVEAPQEVAYISILLTASRTLPLWLLQEHFVWISEYILYTVCRVFHNFSCLNLLCDLGVFCFNSYCQILCIFCVRSLSVFAITNKKTTPMEQKSKLIV